MSWKRLILGFGVAIYAGIVWVADPFLLMMASVFVVGLGLAVTFIAIVMLIFAVRYGCSRRPAIVTLAGSATVFLLTLASWPLNHFAQEYAVATAKAYPERIAPLLEAHRKAHNAYPTSFDELVDKPMVPRPLRWSPYSYRSDGASYSFNFPQPGAMMDAWDYNSSDKVWTMSD